MGPSNVTEAKLIKHWIHSYGCLSDKKKGGGGIKDNQRVRGEPYPLIY